MAKDLQFKDKNLINDPKWIENLINDPKYFGEIVNDPNFVSIVTDRRFVEKMIKDDPAFVEKLSKNRNYYLLLFDTDIGIKIKQLMAQKYFSGNVDVAKFIADAGGEEKAKTKLTQIFGSLMTFSPGMSATQMFYNATLALTGQPVEIKSAMYNYTPIKSKESIRRKITTPKGKREIISELECTPNPDKSKTDKYKTYGSEEIKHKSRKITKLFTEEDENTQKSFREKIGQQWNTGDVFVDKLSETLENMSFRGPVRFELGTKKTKSRWEEEDKQMSVTYIFTPFLEPKGPFRTFDFAMADLIIGASSSDDPIKYFKNHVEEVKKNNEATNIIIGQIGESIQHPTPETLTYGLDIALLEYTQFFNQQLEYIERVEKILKAPNVKKQIEYLQSLNSNNELMTCLRLVKQYYFYLFKDAHLRYLQLLEPEQFDSFNAKILDNRMKLQMVKTQFDRRSCGIRI